MVEKTVMLTYAEAINSALKEEMRRDERVVLFGEDLISYEGVWGRACRGIYDEFGGDRIKDTTLTEQAIVGMAYGAGMTGLRPVAFLMFFSLVLCAADQVFLKLGSSRQEWGYRGPLPVVIITWCYGGGGRGGGIGEDHAASPEAVLVHSPGLKVVMPSTPYDAKGLLKSAIRDNEPVIFSSHMMLYTNVRQAIPAEEYLVPIGKADIKREGKDITIVSYSSMMTKALVAAEELSKQGISAEVVDLRTLVPMDIDTVVNSVKKTGRLLIVHEAMKRGGMAGEIGFRFIEAAPEVMKTMKTPMRRIGAKNVGLLRSMKIGPMLFPQVEEIVSTVKEMV